MSPPPQRVNNLASLLEIVNVKKENSLLRKINIGCHVDVSAVTAELREMAGQVALCESYGRDRLSEAPQLLQFSATATTEVAALTEQLDTVKLTLANVAQYFAAIPLTPFGSAAQVSEAAATGFHQLSLLGGLLSGLHSFFL